MVLRFFVQADFWRKRVNVMVLFMQIRIGWGMGVVKDAKKDFFGIVM